MSSTETLTRPLTAPREGGVVHASKPVPACRVAFTSDAPGPPKRHRCALPPSAKASPLMSTRVPPCTGPERGSTLTTVGCAVYSKPLSAAGLYCWPLRLSATGSVALYTPASVRSRSFRTHSRP